MVTITNDTLSTESTRTAAAATTCSARRCDPYVNKLLTGAGLRLPLPLEPDPRDRAVAPHRARRARRAEHLPGDRAHPVTGSLLHEGRARRSKGDFFEFFAEIDLLCAISTCPGGDLSIPLWGPDARDPLEVCRPLGVEVWQPDAGLLAGWHSPEPAGYRGNDDMGPPPPRRDERARGRPDAGGDPSRARAARGSGRRDAGVVLARARDHGPPGGRHPGLLKLELFQHTGTFKPRGALTS